MRGKVKPLPRRWRRTTFFTAALLVLVCVQGCSDADTQRHDGRVPQVEDTTDPYRGSRAAQPTDDTPAMGRVLCELETLPDGVQQRLNGGNSLTLDLATISRARHLFVVTPSGSRFKVVYERREGVLSQNPMPEEFALLKEFSFRGDQLVGRRSLYGSPDAELVFQELGVYKLIWGRNLQTEGPMPADSVSVLFCAGRT